MLEYGADEKDSYAYKNPELLFTRHPTDLFGFVGGCSMEP